MQFRHPKEIWNDPREKIVEFGRIFCVGLFLIGTILQWAKADWQWSWTAFVESSHVAFYFWSVGGIVLTIVSIAAWAVRPLYFIWLLFGQSMGWVVNHIIFMLVYYVVFTPVGLLFRRHSKVIAKRPDPDLSSYWEEKRTGKDKRSYYRQF